MSLWGTYLEELLDVSFNGVSLQSITGGQITTHDFERMPEIRSSQNSISSAHRSITAGRFFIAKRATVNIAVAGEFHELQAILGRVRQLIQYKNKEIVLTRGVPVLDGGDYDLDTTTKVTFREANMVDADLNPNDAKGKVITIEFLIDDPVGIGGTPQTLLNATGVTTASTSLDLSALELQGTFQEQYPIYEITINSLTNGSNPSISIVNGLSQIVISQEFSSGDVIKVDTDAMKVTLNDEIIDFDGGFPFIADTESTIYISDTFTARNVNRKVTMNPRYI